MRAARNDIVCIVLPRPISSARITLFSLANRDQQMLVFLRIRNLFLHTKTSNSGNWKLAAEYCYEQSWRNCWNDNDNDEPELTCTTSWEANSDRPPDSPVASSYPRLRDKMAGPSAAQTLAELLVPTSNKWPQHHAKSNTSPKVTEWISQAHAIKVAKLKSESYPT